MKKTIIISLVLLVISIGLKSFAGQYNVYSPQVYKQSSMLPGNNRRNMDGEVIELLVDYSGSMSNWIKIATETLSVIVPRIDKNIYLALRVFGDESNVYSNSCTATRMVSNFKKDNNTTILNELVNTPVGGMTPLTYALRETVEKDLRYVSSKPGGKKRIILVTDGYDVCRGEPCAYIRQVVKTRKDIKIDVVQMGEGDQLMCLTAATGGSYYKVKDKVRFQSAFEQIFQIPAGTVSKVIKEQSKPNNIQNKQNPNRGYKFINY